MVPSSVRCTLATDEPPPVAVHNRSGCSRILLIGDHAGRAIPRALGDLGLGAEELRRHIAWDIGVRALGESLAGALDATFIHQIYSRLVIDCNRLPGTSQSVAEISDGTVVPGNRGLDAGAIDARVAGLHAPYHAAIADELGRRRARGERTILVSLHSFTPVMGGHARPWEVGLLHDRGDTSFTAAVLRGLLARQDLCVGDNEPYKMDGTDYTVPRHAYPASIPYAEFEVRQDLIATAQGVDHWTRILAEVIAAASAE